ncbi:hypothetical protein DBR44_16005 [Aquitalea sp. FJL05]|uniref:hypothetical protein n=1 Tax=Aquitalea TaxID=407217 RepID=UPI000F59BBD4|nr:MULTISPECIES: hypothetical protein [Aquitalea]RQO68184.1 hypothetical protein DBR44_16005 [Aquitalea sp. FJL05]
MNLSPAEKDNTKQDRKSIALPTDLLQSPSRTITGQANLKFLRMIHILIGVITLALGLALLAIPFLKENNNYIAVFFISISTSTLCIVSSIAILRQARTLPHHEMWLNNSHFVFKTPLSLILEPGRKEREIRWADVIKAPKGLYDVYLEFSTSKSIVYDLVFWHQNSDTPEEVRAPLRRFSKRTFTNGYDLKRSLLLKLASLNPDFRFDPAVFVEAGIDPETWAEMRKPLLMKRAMLFPSALIFMITGLDYPFWQKTLLFIFTAIIYATIFMLIWAKTFPQFYRTIYFHLESPAPQE